MNNNEDLTCCESYMIFWKKYRLHIISKGTILVSILSSTFSILDVYFPEYVIAKYICLGLLNLGIVMSGYAFGQIEVQADLLDIENKSLQKEKNELVKRLTYFHFPVSTEKTDKSQVNTETPKTPLNEPFNEASVLHTNKNNDSSVINFDDLYFNPAFINKPTQEGDIPPNTPT